MTEDRVREVIGIYHKKLESMGVTKGEDYPHDELLKDSSAMPALIHCRRVLDKMEEFIKARQMDKVRGWLYFIQGVLWANKVYTLTELQNHNRKDPPQSKA